jgi:hypothetical protein
VTEHFLSPSYTIADLFNRASSFRWCYRAASSGRNQAWLGRGDARSCLGVREDYICLANACFDCVHPNILRNRVNERNQRQCADATNRCYKCGVWVRLVCKAPTKLPYRPTASISSVRQAARSDRIRDLNRKHALFSRGCIVLIGSLWRRFLVGSAPLTLGMTWVTLVT